MQSIGEDNEMRKGLFVLAVSVLVLASPTSGWAQAQPQPSTTETDLQHQREQRVTLPEGTLDEAIARVKQAGLMGQSPDGKFHPDRPLNRAELASILVKAFKLKSREATVSRPEPLKDVRAGFWAADDIHTVVNRGIMEGYRNGYFYPQHPVDRAEALAIFAQAYGVQQYDDQTVNSVLTQYPDAAQLPDWSRKSIVTSLKNGFVDVKPSEKIRPEQPMTRGAMAYVLNQYLNRLDESEQRRLH